jgi:hypothetical protein
MNSYHKKRLPLRQPVCGPTPEQSGANGRGEPGTKLNVINQPIAEIKIINLGLLKYPNLVTSLYYFGALHL